MKKTNRARFDWVLDHDTDVSGLQKEPRSGDKCPKCGEAVLEYDGLLNLTCPICGYAVGGCFT